MFDKEDGTKLPVHTKTEMVPWYPPEWSDLDRIFREIPSLILDRPWPPAIWGRGLSRLKAPEIRAPYYDLIDMGKEYKLRAEIPGIPRDKIDITIDTTSVEISAEAKTETDEEKKGYVSRERTYSSLYRSVAFPEEVIPEKAEATYRDGILELTVPKKIPTEIIKHKVHLK